MPTRSTEATVPERTRTAAGRCNRTAHSTCSVNSSVRHKTRGRSECRRSASALSETSNTLPKSKSTVQTDKTKRNTSDYIQPDYTQPDYTKTLVKKNPNIEHINRRSKSLGWLPDSTNSHVTRSSSISRLSSLPVDRISLMRAAYAPSAPGVSSKPKRVKHKFVPFRHTKKSEQWMNRNMTKKADKKVIPMSESGCQYILPKEKTVDYIAYPRINNRGGNRKTKIPVPVLAELLKVPKKYAALNEIERTKQRSKIPVPIKNTVRNSDKPRIIKKVKGRRSKVGNIVKSTGSLNIVRDITDTQSNQFTCSIRKLDISDKDFALYYSQAVLKRHLSTARYRHRGKSPDNIRNRSIRKSSTSTTKGCDLTKRSWSPTGSSESRLSTTKARKTSNPEKKPYAWENKVRPTSVTKLRSKSAITYANCSPVSPLSTISDIQLHGQRKPTAERSKRKCKYADVRSRIDSGINSASSSNGQKTSPSVKHDISTGDSASSNKRKTTSGWRSCDNKGNTRSKTRNQNDTNTWSESSPRSLPMSSPRSLTRSSPRSSPGSSHRSISGSSRRSSLGSSPRPLSKSSPMSSLRSPRSACGKKSCSSRSSDILYLSNSLTSSIESMPSCW